MRFPLAAGLFAVLLFAGVVGYIATSTIIENMEDQLTTADMLNRLGTRSTTYQNEWDIARLGHGVAWAVYFTVITVLFVVDALRREHEEYYPPGGM